MNPITIKQYIETVKKELEQFQNFLELNQNPNSELFPTHLNIGDWDKRFRMYNNI